MSDNQSFDARNPTYPVRGEARSRWPVAEPAGGSRTIAIFADRAHLRADLADDAAMAGMTVNDERPFSELLDPAEAGANPADIILADCPLADPEALAALAHLATRAHRRQQHLIVSTTLDALDRVYAALAQGEADLLVSPTRTDWLLALARAGTTGASRVRENSNESHLVLLRLTEQVSQLAHRIAAISGDMPQPHRAERASTEDAVKRTRSSRPALPDPRLVRTIIRHRQMRARFLDDSLLADPAWDMTSKISGKSIYFKAAA